MVRIFDKVITFGAWLLYLLNIIPAFTLFVACFFVIQTISATQFGYSDLSSVCFKFPESAFDLHRILSSAIFHNTFGHFLFDICLLLIFGVTCEHALGTIGILNATLFFQLISSLLRLCLHFVYPIKVCTTGFSGILFAYMMVSVYMETRHVKRGYLIVAIVPWICLFGLEAILPYTSFTHNLSGIIAAYIFIYYIMKSKGYKALNEWIDSMLPLWIIEWNNFAISRKQEKPTTISKSHQHSLLGYAEYTIKRLTGQVPTYLTLQAKRTVFKYTIQTPRKM